MARIKFTIFFGWPHIIKFLPMKNEDVAILLTRCFVSYVQFIQNPAFIC
ncbi:hypothetical protein LINGRAHAP2_LOCUS1629 [Linum grandiflorum]